ncbi:hypothetical protein EHS25_006827 [Saitozyma podzolica]|uniref:Ig-like domain-containing protein n=1 Tax=Saitozyma podzolica TaxID=1890683 RepID=A0A427XRK7_9TREE|nr:hypothetical protein EHS25_006827 [Saitozyma podzolica]
MRLLLLCTAQFAFAASLVFAATPLRGHRRLRDRGGADVQPRAGATIRSDTSATIPPTGYRRGLLNERDTPPTSSSACTQTVPSTVFVTSTATSYTTINVTSTTTLTTAAANTATYSANAMSTYSCSCPSSTAAVVSGAPSTSSAAAIATSAATGTVASAVTSAGTATVAIPTSASAATSASASAACTPGWGMVNMVANLYTSIVANVTTNNFNPCTWGYGTTSLNRTCNSPSWAFVYNVYAASDNWESTAPTNTVACVLSGVGTDELNAPVLTVYHEEPFLTVYPNNSGISVTCS